YEAFKVWDAKFLLIAGAGREVLWTNAAPYNNSKSLSDPTRVAAHPFNTAYKKFADVIRAQDSIRELSVQIHTYDWNYHAGYPNIQISAGYNKLCPNLPIRDLSSQKLDIVNQGSHLMIPANTIGLHRDVFLNDYYAVNYNVHDFTFSDGEQEYAVNDYIDLPAYSQNQQMLYTLSGWNDYDSYDPFFHIEMDELPNSYDLTENTYKWFYGWNENLQRWDFDNLFTNFNAYYMPWINNLNSVLNPMFTMNDGVPPTAPTGLTVQNQSLNSITLRWTKTDSYDFSTYEILYGTEPIGIDNYQVFDRNSAGFLASADCESITVTGLANSNSYFFQIRAKDKNGMLSPASNEVTTVPAPANIYSFAAFGVDNAIRLNWGVSGQVNNSGFTVYRKSIDSDWATLDSYATNPALVNATANNFEWWDHDVTNGQTWTYMISSTNTLGNQFYYNYPATASPQPIHTIWIKNADATLVDSVFFAQNPYASDAQDTYYDVTKASPSSPAYVWNAFWQPYWGNNGTQLLREIKGGYDTNLDLKTWTMRVRSTQLNTPLFISASDSFDRAQKLYVYDSGNQTWHNLFESPYQFMVANTNVRTMTLYWGNLQPKVVHGNQNNRLYQGGTNVTFNWSYQNSFLIDHLDVYIKGETDSLFVAGGMTSSQTSFTYMLPQMTNIQNARLMIDVHAVDGLVSTYSSSYRFGIVPSMSQHYNESGWQTRANPWLDNTTPVTSIFGAGSSALSTTEEGAWGDTSDFSFGLPYWVNSPDVNFYSTMNAINPLETTLPLQPGWNSIPNPHLCEYPINNLRFTVNNSLFRYSEMIAQKLISPLVFVYRNGGYQAVDSILPYETFFVKYYGNPILETNISFYPYFTAPAIIPPASYWQFIATFSGAST
ncbi:MAG: fibronectin type III domain-containing protein, partial [Candidatus Cloacimonetes bacterium]|nr:fibronectin type III domain-containing protein [Candidatus Cloacimonadota bacterium]